MKRPDPPAARSGGPDELRGVRDVDRIVHEPARLNLLLHLATVDEAAFTFLQRSTGLTKGNLSAHARKLERAGYVRVRKEFVEDRPTTLLSITAEGRTALSGYRDLLSRLLASIPG
jgi:DNA-binding MarR family transcriptional regulator